MKDGKGSFDILESIERHIEALNPLLPKQALVCIGEFPIKMLLRDLNVSKETTLPILVEKSSEEVYKWLPKGFSPHLVLGFEEAHIDTHFWYNAMPAIMLDDSIIGSIQKKSSEKLRYATIFSSIWDGLGSAALPTLIRKFKASNMDSFSIAILPSKIQPIDAHFNAYAAMKICSVTDGATVLLMDRDHVESYEGVDRIGEPIKGNMILNYMLNLFLTKTSLVEEISELSRTFNTKFFTPIVVTGASCTVYGSIENMLNAALLKPFLTFDLSTASLLYVFLRVPANLKDKLPRGKIELAITNWFKGKTTLQSIYIAEPIYTEDLTDRVDAVLLVGGFEIGKMLSDLEQKVSPLKNLAVEKGFMTEDGSFIIKVEEKPVLAEVSIAEISQAEPSPSIGHELLKENPPPTPEPQITPSTTEVFPEQLPTPAEQLETEETQLINETQSVRTQPPVAAPEDASETQIVEASLTDIEKAVEPKPLETSKNTPRTKKARTPTIDKEEPQTPTKSRRKRSTGKQATKES
jgi:hypothetical protein